MEQWMTVAEAASYLGVPESSMRYWIVERIAPKSTKIGRRRQFQQADLAAWVAAGGPEGARQRRAEDALAS